MAHRIAIPRTPDDITADWLTHALQSNGVLADAAHVTAIARQPVGEGVGFVGNIVRLTPTYEGDAGNAPSTLIAKMPSPDPGARQIAMLYGLYEREYQFYCHVAPQVTLRSARCYYADGDADSVAYVLLMEDLAPTGDLGDQVHGVSLDDALTATRALARHHAHWWAHPQLDTLAGIGNGVDLVRGAMTLVYPQVWQKFLDLMGAHLSQDVRDVIPTLDKKILRLLEDLSAGPFTLIHGDYRADNIFFGHPGSDYDVAVIDWQSPNKGWAAYDLSYFICGSVEAGMRKQHEPHLRDVYYETLVGAGVNDYTRDQFDTDFVRSLIAYLGIFVVNGATLDPANERGLDLFRVIFERLDGSIADSNALFHLPA